MLMSKDYNDKISWTHISPVKRRVIQPVDTKTQHKDPQEFAYSVFNKPFHIQKRNLHNLYIQADMMVTRAEVE